MHNGGNTVPRITNAEHIGPNDTGDNIEAKRAANYVWNSDTSNWERMSQPGGSSSTGGATEVEQQTQTEIMEQLTVVIKNLIQSIADPVTLDRSLNRTRQTAIIESGALTSVGTVTTVTGVTTVTTVAGLTNVDSYQGKLLMVGQDMSAWANIVRSRIT